MLNNWHYGKGELRRYGDDDVSYKKAADYLDQAGLVIEDWGCGAAYGRQFFKESLYFGIDGGTSDLIDKQVDLRTYTSDVDCILIRHVLEHNNDWEKVLSNAMGSFRKKMVLIIFTPFETETKTININQPTEDFLMDAVPSISFKKEDLLKHFSEYSYTEEFLETQTEYGVETIFYINKEDQPVSRQSIFGQPSKEALKKEEVPRVSVVVPCYNYGHYLSGALYSVLEQTFQDFEIIVVDDGSSDRYTQKIISKISHPKIRVIIQDNAGLSAARNAGIRAAKGEFIIPLDADDKLAPEYLERCFSVFEENPHIGFIYTATLNFGNYNAIWLESYDFIELTKRNLLTATAFYKKSDWFAVGGYNESLGGYEDWDFWIHLGEHGIYGTLLPEPLFLYRKHTPSMLHTITDKHDYLYAEIKKLHPSIFDLESQAEFFDQWRAYKKAKNETPFSLPPKSVGHIADVIKQSQERIQEQSSELHYLKQQLELAAIRQEESDRQLKNLSYNWGKLRQSRGWRIISFLHNLRMKIPFINRIR